MEKMLSPLEDSLEVAATILARFLQKSWDMIFYDAEIIQMTAGTTGYTPEFVKKNEEIMTNSLLYDLSIRCI